jgi:hypothetical protein
MRRVLVLALLLLATRSSAQPGPGRPLTLARAQALGDRIARDAKLMLAGDRAAEARVHAARDRADAFDELYGALMSPVAGGAASIDEGAERALRDRTGLSFADFRRGSAPAWRRCGDLVRTLHVLGDEARLCVRRALADHFATEVALDAFALQTTELQSGDFDGVIAHVTPGTYEADLTIAVAKIGQGQFEAADARLVELIRREPSRPEAHYNRALLAASRRYLSEQKSWIVAQDRLAFLHFRAFLCTREAARMRIAGDLWLAATRGAEDAERRLTGGTHWSWRTGDKRPRPFLPQPLLPAQMRDTEGAAAAPTSTCAEVMKQAR